MIALAISVGATWGGMFIDGAYPWVWILLAVQLISLVVGVVFLVRFVRAQRDDYWRERGRGPRDPARPRGA